MGATATLCGGREPKEPVEPRFPREPREPGGPCMKLLSEIADASSIKLSLYEYLFDSKCEGAQLAKKEESDSFAELLASAFISSLLNVSDSYDRKDLSLLPPHDVFGMSVITKMFAYAVESSEGIVSEEFEISKQSKTEELIQGLQYYNEHNSQKNNLDLTDLPFLLAQCYVKAINETRAARDSGNKSLTHHHLQIVYDILTFIVQVFGNRTLKPT